MAMKVRVPTGPIRPVLGALWENEILQGYVKSIEDSAAYQFRQLKQAGWQFVEEEDRFHHTLHGLDGETWHLETLFSEHFPALQRAATFLVMWGAFEHSLDELCREVAIAADLKVKVSDLKDTGIRRARTYLTKVAELLGDNTPDSGWQELANLQKLRNVFAHRDGTLTDNDKHEREYTVQSPHITLRGSTVVLEPSFMPHVLEAQRGVLLLLKQAVEERFGKFEAVVYE